jgi:DNA polymerase-1
MQKFINKSGEDFDNAVSFLSVLNVIALDTETTSVDPLDGKILLISAGNGDIQYVFDVAHIGEAIAPLLKVLANKKILKILHNAKFDYKFFYRDLGTEIEPVFDTMLAEMLLLKGRKVQGVFGLDDVADKYLGIKLDKDIRKSFAGMVFGDDFSNDQIKYSGEDVQYLHKIRDAQLAFIRKHELEKVCQIEMDVLPSVAEMELYGVYIDRVKWLKAEEDAKTARDAALIKLDEFFIPHVGADIFGRAQINYNSPKQLLPRIKDIVGTAAKGLTSTNEASLKTIEHPLILAILDYKKQAKRISTYGVSFLDNVHHVTGRIHSNFSQLYTDTGRFSSSDPNLQNIPRLKVYRQSFTSGDPRYRIITIDYSGMELRILADLSKEDKWIEVFKNKGDLHCEIGTMLWGVPIRVPGTNGPGDPGENYELRQPTKTLNFGISYGMGPRKFSSQTGIEYDKARTIVSTFWKTFPAIKRYFDKHVAQSIDARCVRCPYDNRLKWIEGVDFDSQREMAGTRNMCMNFPMQAGNATITKRAMAIIRNNFQGKDAKIIGTVHDEIIVRAHESIAQEAYDIVRNGMISAGQEFITNLPVDVEGKIDMCWNK